LRLGPDNAARLPTLQSVASFSTAPPKQQPYIHDVVRLPRRHPSITLTTVLFFAVAICTNVVTFGEVGSVLLESLPFPGSGTDMTVWNGRPDHMCDVMVPDMFDLPEQSHSIARLVAYQPLTLTLFYALTP
jgi:hypothetical protein